MSFDFVLSEYFPDEDGNKDIVIKSGIDSSKDNLAESILPIEKPLENEKLVQAQVEDKQIKKQINKQKVQENLPDIIDEKELEKLLAKVIPLQIEIPDPFCKNHQELPKLVNVIETDPFQFNLPLQSLAEQFKQKVAQLEHAEALIAKIIDEQEKLNEFNKKLKEEVLSPRLQQIENTEKQRKGSFSFFKKNRDKESATTSETKLEKEPKSSFSLFQKKKEKKTIDEEVSEAIVKHEVKKAILQVTSVVPTGAQNTNQLQVKIRFNHALGPLDDLAILPTINPPPKGGEWVTYDKELLFANGQFSFSESYTVTIPQKFATATGETLQDSKEFKFTTKLNTVDCVLPLSVYSPHFVMAIVFSEPVNPEDVLPFVSAKSSIEFMIVDKNAFLNAPQPESKNENEIKRLKDGHTVYLAPTDYVRLNSSVVVTLKKGLRSLLGSLPIPSDIQLLDGYVVGPLEITCTQSESTIKLTGNQNIRWSEQTDIIVHPDIGTRIFSGGSLIYKLENIPPSFNTDLALPETIASEYGVLFAQHKTYSFSFNQVKPTYIYPFGNCHSPTQVFYYEFDQRIDRNHVIDFFEIYRVNGKKKTVYAQPRLLTEEELNADAHIQARLNTQRHGVYMKESSYWIAFTSSRPFAFTKSYEVLLLPGFFTLEGPAKSIYSRTTSITICAPFTVEVTDQRDRFTLKFSHPVQQDFVEGIIIEPYPLLLPKVQSNGYLVFEKKDLQQSTTYNVKVPTTLVSPYNCTLASEFSTSFNPNNGMLVESR